MTNNNMKRTQVFLPVVLVDKLDFLSTELGISKGEIIRTAIFQYFGKIDMESLREIVDFIDSVD